MVPTLCIKGQFIDMICKGSHPLLEQVPLTVSPFVNLPSATTLPYTYKPMPSTLPPSATGMQASAAPSDEHDPATAKPKYVVSASGHAAHPDDIIASCRALQAHISRLQTDARTELEALEARIRERELAEKRRVAPGWLDSDARLLQPEREGGGGVGAAADGLASMSIAEVGPGPADHPGPSEMAAPDPGEELDRVFGVAGGSGSGAAR